ncbi:hypothetical protein CQW23_06651 [Capsicum baccatum]|uniref:Uncharacterized protein n=1 Tax=Capsicum baccatum TaxID=33114 RepID=A0A2G2X447_CAPBA|nr:hypothetical protein CQW23_06651 [Capsicum baccatum]
MEAVAGKVIDLIEKAGTYFIRKIQNCINFGEDLKTLERNVKQLSDKAVDMKTDVENQERSGRKKRRRQVESWLNEVEQLKEELRQLKEEATRGEKNRGVLKKLNGRVAELEQRGDFGELVLDVDGREECPMQVQPVHEEKSKQNLEVVWTGLHDENVSSIGIYGMGGVGKTTLAKHIYNRLLEESCYQVYWVTVSQWFTIEGLQDDFAKIVKLNLSHVKDKHGRADQLNWAFKKMKNIVIILDDVWEHLRLEELGYPLGMEGYKLILTTRSFEVYQKIGCKELLKVKKLNASDAWELFRKSLGSETRLSPDVERVAKSMAGRCEGLPLGLITLAGSMRGVTDIREWNNALNKFPDDMEKDVFKVLKYSYDQLNDGSSDITMQECFLYCALYPEDHKIGRDKLIGKFIMEGLVKGNSREEEFNDGHTILNKLVKCCLLEATVDDFGDELVRMHDLLRETALRITNDKPRYLVRSGIGPQVLEEQDWAFNLDRVSYHKSRIKRIPEDMAPNCPTLSTLILSNCDSTMIPGPFFQYMNKLQVVDLSYNSELMDLPSSISNLESLRALSLRGCSRLKSVPPLAKLKNSRVLDVSYTIIKEVPQGMEN